MPYAITYTDNIQTLTIRGLELCEQGKWPEYMHAVSLDDDNDGVPDRIALTMIKVKTAYAPSSMASLCLVRLPLRDIAGEDEENPEYIGFCEDMGLTVLAYGENRGVDCPYKQIESGVGDTLSINAKALYESVKPPVDILDADENPTGETRFNYHIEFARTPRDE
jgi:hypothetical protein